MAPILFIKAEQLNLFATPTHVEGYTKKDGTYVGPHIASRKKRLEPHHQASLFEHQTKVADPKKDKTTALDRFIAKHGGPARMADTLKHQTPEARAKLIDAMAQVGGVDAKAVMGMLGMAEPIKSTAVDSNPIDVAPVVSRETPVHATQAGLPSTDKTQKPLGAKAKRALAILKEGGFFRKMLHTQYRGGEKFETHFHEKNGGIVPGIGIKTYFELDDAGYLISRSGIPRGTDFRSEYLLWENGPGMRQEMSPASTRPGDVSKKSEKANTSEPKEGDTKTENGIEYQLRGGRWHRVTPEEDRPGLEKGTETAGTPAATARWRTSIDHGMQEGTVLGYTTEGDVRFRADSGEEVDLPPHALFPIIPERKAAIWPGDLPETASDDERDEAWQDWRDSLFDAPAKTVKAEDVAKQSGVMTQEEADQALEDWVKTAQAQDKGKNSGKTILSLFDHTGYWSTPFIDAGYNVIQVDLKDGVDIMDFSPEYFADLGIDDVHGILAACPCTDFAGSGARWWDEKDKDGRTKASIGLVHQTLGIIEHFAPKFWAIENPVGRIQKLTGLNKPTLTFQPHHYGDPYTKKTQLYGKFNPDLPQANVKPTEGSRIIKLSSSGKGKEDRSTTPSGFAYAFFMANGDVQDNKPAETPVSARETTSLSGTPNNETAFGVPAGIGKAERRRLNAEAAALVAEKDPADLTGADKAVLRQYSGNGGCGDSLNEFYTDPAVAGAMWSVASRLGFPGSTALEPSCATGVFLHTAPQGVKVTGIELDPVSASIATALHGDRHEIVNASLERFATQDMRQFGIVVGNPPYGPRGALLKDDKKDIGKAEEYFIDTSLDKTESGGLCLLVVPAGIMDSKNGRAFRERMLRKAEFLGAQRMPNTAFEAAHTDVTADILYLRKRPQDVAGALGTVDQDALRKLGVWDDEFLSGDYFTGRGAGNVFGTPGTAQRSFGEIYTVNGAMAGVPEEIARFVPHPVGLTPDVAEIVESLSDEAAKDRALAGAKSRPYEDGARVGDLRTIDGVTYVLQGNPPRWHRVDEAMQTEAVTEAQALAGEIDRLMTGQAADRVKLEADIRAWVGRHGNPAKNPNLLVAAATDKTLYRLIGAVGKDGELSDVVTGAVPQRIAGSFDTVAQGLALKANAGDFSVAELSEALDKDEEETLDHLTADEGYAWMGLDRWAPMDLYLTGELWPKRDAAKAMLEESTLGPGMREKLDGQVAKLEALIDAKSLEDVEIKLNSAFVPLKVLNAWRDAKVAKMREDYPSSTYYRDIQPSNVTFDHGVYKVKGGAMDPLLEKYLNRSGVKKDDLPVVERMNQEFKDWLCASSYRDEIEELYNRKFKGFVPRAYSDEPIDVPGLANHDQIKGYQWPGLRWALAAGKGIIAADVGLGKTLRGLLLARMAKINGSATKPIITVPKSVLANWYAEANKWFPGAKVLTIGGEFTMKDGQLVGRDDNANERKRKYHDLSQNDYDFVIISEPAFQELDLDPIVKDEYYSKDFWAQRGDAMEQAGDKRKKRIREQAEQERAKREIGKRTDAIYFNDIGVDMVIADEMHHQKNLYAARARFGESPKFLGGQGLSDRSMDFNLKARWLLDRNGGKGVYGLTATPTKNSPLEIYSMISHVAPASFEAIGIRNSEEFLDRFCRFENGTILSTAGEVEDALVTAGFKNMGELREIMKRHIDRTTAEDVGLQLPGRNDQMHLVDMSPRQVDVYGELRALLEESAGNKDATGDAHIFSIMDKMNKAALDLEILDSAAYAGEASPKYAAIAKNVTAGLRDGGQVIFSDYVDSHGKIVDALVAAGVPRDQIGVINAQVASSAAKRQNIADAYNAGKLRVVIGNTATMGEGLNLQKGTTDIHHADLPWEPASMQQRNGRGLRQGNTAEAVRIHSYLARGSFDGYRHQAIAAKKDWQDLIWSGGDTLENLAREGQFTREDMLVMMAADPDAARKKLDENKSAAQAKYEAGERVKAAGEFVRFQELKAGFKALKNQGTQSAQRLKSKIDALHTSLKANRNFRAKSALDSDEATVIQPQTGDAYHAGVAFQAVEDDGRDAGKFVVTGVNVRAGTVTVREYGGTIKDTVPLDKLAHGITHFAYDPEAEAKEVAAKIEKAAAEKVNSLSAYEDVFAMPSHVLEANHEAIQRQLAEGAKSYKIRFPSGDVPMVDKATGKIRMAESYEHAKLSGTHDYLLPTDANKAKVEQAWLASRRGVTFGTDSVQKRKNSRVEWVAKRKYPDASFSNKFNNPYSRLVNTMAGEKESYGIATPTIKALKQRFRAEQLARTRRAPNLTEAIREAVPLGSIQDSTKGDGATFKWSRRALAILWAKARHEGKLGVPMQDVVPKNPHGYSLHSSYVYANSRADTVLNALAKMAIASGYRDLAHAMFEASTKHGVALEHTGALRALSQGFGHNAKELRQMLRIAEQGGLADKTRAELGFGDGILSSGAVGWGWQQDRVTSVSDTLKKKIAEAEARENKQENAA